MFAQRYIFCFVPRQMYVAFAILLRTWGHTKLKKPITNDLTWITCLVRVRRLSSKRRRWQVSLTRWSTNTKPLPPSARTPRHGLKRLKCGRMSHKQPDHRINVSHSTFLCLQDCSRTSCTLWFRGTATMHATHSCKEPSHVSSSPFQPAMSRLQRSF